MSILNDFDEIEKEYKDFIENPLIGIGQISGTEVNEISISILKNFFDNIYVDSKLLNKNIINTTYKYTILRDTKHKIIPSNFGLILHYYHSFDCIPRKGYGKLRIFTIGFANRPSSMSLIYDYFNNKFVYEYNMLNINLSQIENGQVIYEFIPDKNICKGYSHISHAIMHNILNIF